MNTHRLQVKTAAAGNKVKSLVTLAGYVSQIMLNQFAGKVHVICADIAYMLSS